MIVKAQIAINRNSAATWATITDIRNAAKIINGIEKIEILFEPAGNLVGLKWRETRMYFGKPTPIEKWIVEAIENKSYTTRAEMDGYIFISTTSIAETGNSIILISSHETKPQNFLAKIKSFPMIFFKGMIKKAIQQDLADIKKAIESKKEP